MGTPKRKSVMGIDPGIAKAAVCPATSAIDCEPLLYEVGPEGKSVRQRFLRYYRMCERIMEAAEACKPTLVAIEYYSTQSKGSEFLNLAEFGGCLRSELLELDAQLVEVPPINLKQFCRLTGKGTKLQMVADITYRWNVRFSTHDEYDAYGLARMALVMAGIEKPEHQAQKKAVDSVLHGRLSDGAA